MIVGAAHILLNPAPLLPQGTVAVTGMGRSGTTMVTRVLAALGLPLGPDASANFLEEPQIVSLLKANDMAGFAALCRARDADHNIWAFKCPALRVRMAEADQILRQPRYIVTYRDVVATVTRSVTAADAPPDWNSALEAQVRKQYNLIRELMRLEAPILLLSYEKALALPAETVAEIARFVGHPLAPAAKIAAAEIRAGDPRYKA